MTSLINFLNGSGSGFCHHALWMLVQAGILVGILWGLDFLHDSMGNGRKLRILPIIDTHTKECHWIEVDRSIGGKRVTSVLGEVASDVRWK